MKLGCVSVSYPQNWAIKPCGDSPMAILRMTWVSLWEPYRSVFSTLQALPGTFFFFKSCCSPRLFIIWWQDSSPRTSVLPWTVCFSLHTDYFPTLSLPITTKLLQSPAPMWLLHVASDSDTGGTPNLLSTAHLLPKESPHFILLLKVKP